MAPSRGTPESELLTGPSILMRSFFQYVLPVLWFVGHSLMFLWLGDDWRYVWTWLNLPLSELLKKPLWPLGVNVYFYGVTAANAAMAWVLIKVWLCVFHYDRD